MNDTTIIDLTAFLDSRKLGRYHLQILIVCGLCCFVSGFFVVGLGFIAPVAATALHLEPGALGPVFAAMGLGSFVGSLVFTPAADRFGRKPVMLAGLLIAVPFLFLMGTAESVASLIWMQFFGGFALMGTIPIVLALAGEFMPKHTRVTLTMLVWIGFNLGSIVTGLVAARITAGGDWHYLFDIAGTLALVAAPIVALLLPESLDFLAESPGTGPRIARILGRLDPSITVPPGTRFVLEEKEEHGFPVTLLFREDRKRLTLFLWLMFFCNMMALVFINSWLATLLVAMGIATSTAIVTAALTNLGGILGGIAVSEFCDRYPRHRFAILAASYLLGSVAIAAIAEGGGQALFALAASFIAGFFTMGTQNTANAIAATIYPTAMRSTGAGWAIGMGNIAQILSPLIGGLLLALGWTSATILALAALPPVLAALAAWRIGRHATPFDEAPGAVSVHNASSS
jgi:AAHS family 4-hydroxybenzoate transporter-like MFS transporter